MAIIKSSVANRFEKAVMRHRALAARLRKVDDEPKDFVRADGHVVCEDCGFQYRWHPEHPKREFLTVLCDGSVVKL